MDIRSILGGVGSVPNKTTQQTDSNKTAERADAEGTSTVRRNQETVTLTDTVGRLQKAQAAAESQPEVNSARVEQLRKALADGTYKASPDRIAARLMAFEAALKGR